MDAVMSVRTDCRHYLLRTTASGEALQRCRLAANEESPFDCPEGCLFYEPRSVMGAGWAQAPSQPMSNTSANLPEPPRRKGRGKGKRRR
jgi:hypothetical protein